MIITFIAFGVGVLFFVAGFLLKYSFVNNMMFAIGIITALVPEGLLATITITLSVSATTRPMREIQQRLEFR